MRRTVVLRPSRYSSILKVTFDLSDVHASQNGNFRATRNRLRYLSLAFTVRPRFQHLLKIQHRLRVWGGAKSLPGARVGEARCRGLGEKTGNGLVVLIGPES
jgi:hypothetical protein